MAKETTGSTPMVQKADNSTPTLPLLELKEEYKDDTNSLFFTNPNTKQRVTKSIGWIKKNGYAVVHAYHQERLFKNDKEDIKKVIAFYDAKKGIDVKSKDYKMRDLKYPAGDVEDFYA